jgi:chorismate dehydratase
VFAAWVSNKQMTNQFIDEFNRANKFGLDNLEQVVQENPYNAYDLHRYYKDNIKFKPQFDKLEVITLFLDKIKSLK